MTQQGAQPEQKGAGYLPVAPVGVYGACCKSQFPFCQVSFVVVEDCHPRRLGVRKFTPPLCGKPLTCIFLPYTVMDNGICI